MSGTAPQRKGPVKWASKEQPVQGCRWASLGVCPSQGLCLLHLLSPQCSGKGCHRESRPCPAPQAGGVWSGKQGSQICSNHPGPAVGLPQRKRHDHFYDNCQTEIRSNQT